MGDKNLYYCYSYRLFHFLCSFNEVCVACRVNSHNGKRYWVFHKNERLDRIIELYNEVKHKIS